jgi:hypothetical protein
MTVLALLTVHSGSMTLFPVSRRLSKWIVKQRSNLDGSFRLRYLNACLIDYGSERRGLESQEADV